MDPTKAPLEDMRLQIIMSALCNVKSDQVSRRRNIAIILSNFLSKVVYAILCI